MSAQQDRRSWSGARARDYYGGALLLMVGLGAVLYGRIYRIGTLTEMGAGFFPVALGTMLAALGALIALNAGREQGSVKPAQEFKPEWRGWACITGSIVAFILAGTHLGLLPATFALVFIAALGDRRNTLLRAALIAGVMCVLCVVVFSWALQLQFPLFLWSWT